MVECPKCKKQVDSLIRFETREYEDEATYDPDTDEMDYESKDDCWGTGNGFGSVIKEEFQCPECSVVLFTEEGKAKEFLADGKIEDAIAQDEGQAAVRTSA